VAVQEIDEEYSPNKFNDFEEVQRDYARSIIEGGSFIS
jgi:hypothetical protein